MRNFFVVNTRILLKQDRHLRFFFCKFLVTNYFTFSFVEKNNKNGFI